MSDSMYTGAVMRVTHAEMEERGDEIRAKAARFDAEIVISDDTSCPYCKDSQWMICGLKSL